MAITHSLGSDLNRSIYDSIWLSAISSASGQTDLKYIVELYDGASKIFEGKVVPEPNNKYMYFDVAPIMRNNFSEEFHTFDFSNNYNIALGTPMGSAELDYRLGSDYSGITTLNEASGSVLAWLRRPKYKNRRYLVDSAAVQYGDAGPKWITDRKLTASLINNSDRFFVGYDVYDSNDETSIKWEAYNSSGILIDSCSYTPVVTGDLATRRILNIGPDGLDEITGTSPNLNTCAYYEVKIRWENLITSQLEYLPAFRINKGCNPKYNTIPIHFYNRFNSVDTMRFDLVSRTTVDVERKSYNQRDYRFSGSSVLYTDSSASGTTVFRENKINYNATYNYTMKLTSDFLDDQDWEWLEDLILSPKVYMEEDGFFYPVTIKATNYEISKYINNRLRPLEIEIEFNSPRLSSSR